MKTATTVLLATLLGAPSPPPAPAPDEPVCPEWRRETPAFLARLQARLAALVDERRKADGAPALELDGRLSAVAEAHARHLAELGAMQHRTSDTGAVEDRVRAAGIFDWDALSENLAQGRPITYTSRNLDGSAPTIACHTPESLALAIAVAWDQSPGHSRTLRDPRFNDLGSGATFAPERSMVYVVHDFAHRVSCGFKGAPCCPAPAGVTGAVCLEPFRCHAGRCTAAPAPPAEPPQP